MAYLGNAPARSFISFERQVFTIVNSQTAYTLSHSVNNENDLRLVINNIVQEPGSGKAYTASGTTLTLSAALTNGTDEMYCVFLGRATATNAPGAGSVNTAAITDLNVTTAKIAADAITEAKIADDAVESEHLNDNVISGFNGTKGVSANIELEFDKYLGLNNLGKFSKWIALKSYAFCDEGVINVVESDVNKFAEPRLDAGLGGTISFKKFYQFETTKPVTFRLDFPLLLNRTPNVSPEYYSFKWIIGINRAF